MPDLHDMLKDAADSPRRPLDGQAVVSAAKGRLRRRRQLTSSIGAVAAIGLLVVIALNLPSHDQAVVLGPASATDVGALPTSTERNPDDAQIGGTLIADADGCMWLASWSREDAASVEEAETSEVAVRWLPGYTSRQTDAGYELIDESGQVVAVEGDYVSLGGSQQPDSPWPGCGPSGGDGPWVAGGVGEVVPDSRAPAEGSASDAAAGEFAETAWVSTEVEGIELPDDEAITLAFDDGRVIADIACNAFGGPYEVVDGQLVIEEDDFGTELMLCEGPAGEWDDWFGTLLQARPTVEHDDGQLTLTAGEDRVRFQPAAAPSNGPPDADSTEPTGGDGPPSVDLMYSCGGLPFDPEALLAGPDVTDREGPVYEALRQEIAEGLPEIDYPSGPWVEIGQTDDIAEFLAPDDDPTGVDGLGTHVVFRHEDGQWTRSSAGGCRPTAYDEEHGPATWTLEEPMTDPTTTSFTAHVTERACASGQSSEGRIQAPVIDYRDDAVVVTFFVERLTGGQNCQDNPSTPVDVELVEPLGDRQLLDGGLWPPLQPLEGE